MALRTTTATLALVLLVTGAAQAQWGGDDRRAPGATMVVTTRDGRETRITVADIASIRFEGGGPAARPAVAHPADWIGRVWEVDEGGWRGVWTRIGDSNRFKAVWRNSDDTEQRDELILESVRGDNVVFYRESKRGRYRITLLPDRTRLFHGTADWYRAGDTFTGLIRE